MSYRTIQELEHFNFKDAYIAEMMLITGQYFYTILDNVTILSANSCNRDIFDMRTNNLKLKLEDGEILSFVEEGYKVFDANDVLTRQVDDRPLSPSEYNDAFKNMAGAMIYELTKEQDVYTFSIDTEEHTYNLVIKSTQDVEEWERFLKKEM